MRSRTSRAPGMTCTSSPARWTSVPSTSNTKPRASSSRTAPPHDDVIAAFEAHVADRAPFLQFMEQAHKRVAAWARQGGPSLPRRWRAPHRVHLLGRHGQPQQQLLVGDRVPEALSRPLEAERLEVRQLLGARTGKDRVGDLGIDRRGGCGVVAEK